MKLAIPVLDNNGKDSKISEHFGHAPFFAFVDVKGNDYDVSVEENPMAESHGPGQIPNYVHEKNVDVMVVRGIGGRAIQFFQQLGIEVYRGAAGSVSEIAEEYIKGNIEDKDYEVADKHHHHGHE
ncbi:MAG: NifB/NifX family molybdenum-iron cluster-binding protein [Thermotogota bacterium]